MKQIKIVPFPNYKITEECIERDIKPNSKKFPDELETNPINLNVPNVAIIEFSDENRRVVRMGPYIQVDDKKYCSIFPNPVSLFVDSAIEYFNISEKIKETSFLNCAQKK